MDPRDAARRITRWAHAHPQPFPWRRRHRPYEVLVAEFMLQQTRMETMLPFYRRFLRRFPTLAALAAAPERDVLADWSGLGYYRRARNLHATARAILHDHGGHVPRDAAMLQALPGIGPYTAGAIASIAYDRPEPALDGNQERVASRFLGLRAGAAKARRRRMEGWLRGLLDAGSPRVLNQALMDLGRDVCVPEAPRCGACPLAAGCAWSRRPTTRRRTIGHPVRVESWQALLARRGDDVWLQRPSATGLLAGLWLPPLRRLRGALRRPDVVHRFSHRTWRIQVRHANVPPQSKGRWVRPDGLAALPHSALTRRLVAWPRTPERAPSARSSPTPAPRRVRPATGRA